jgi:hypothetical protein
MLKTYIRGLLGLNLDRDTDYPNWGFHGFPWSVQANIGIAPKLNSDRFLPVHDS